MESFQDTFTVRTREGREFSGLTLSSLRIGATQKIFSLEDAVRSDRVAGAWTPLARVLSLPEPLSSPRVPIPPPPAAQNPGIEPRASTGIALDLEAHASRPQHPAPTQYKAPELPLHPAVTPRSFAEEPEGPGRHRLRVAGAFLLLWGVLGMVGYAFGKHGPADSIAMLVNTGLGIALLMNLQPVRKWAVGWVVAGWALFWGAGALAGGCFGFVVMGFIASLVYGGPACLLWDEECPAGRFWTGVALMGLLVLLALLGMIAIAVAGATLLQRMHV